MWKPVGIYATGLILSIVAFIALLRTDPFGLANLSQNPELPAFFLSIVVLLVSDRISGLFQMQENKEQTKRLADLIKDSHSVVKFRTPRDAIQYISNRIDSLRSVENISVNTDDEFIDVDDYFYRSEQYDSFISSISSGVAKGLIWRDLGDKYAKKRFDKIGGLVAKKKSKGTYQYKLISHNEPQITFTIIQYHDGTREVLFNWDYRSPGAEPNVMLSRDEDLVTMFAIHFTILWKDSSHGELSVDVN